MITVDQLTKRRGRTTVVDHLGFTVQPGRVTGFLGPNGAGKSTTMRMILGLETPTSGQAAVGGRSYRSLERPLRVVGSLLDASDVHPGRSGQRHLEWLAVSNDIPRRRVAQVLEFTGLHTAARCRVRSYSLGMRQRLGLAAALLGDPPILVLDEPTNGLDPEGIKWLRTLLRSLADQGRTIFVSSHLITETALFADHVVVVGTGRLLADVTIAQLTSPPDRSADVADPLRSSASLEAAYFSLTESAVEFHSGAIRSADPAQSPARRATP